LSSLKFVLHKKCVHLSNNLWIDNTIIISSHRVYPRNVYWRVPHV
jgi:hypothetical protein